MTIERYVLPSGRIATLDTSQPASAVAEARRTLVEGFGAVREHEEAPAGQGEGFEITTHPSKDKTMNDTQTTTTTQPTASDVAAAFAAIDQSERRCIILEPSDALYRPIEASFVKPIEWLGEDADESTWIHTAYPVGPDGRKAPIPSEDGWWESHVAEIPDDVYRYWQRTPNAAIRLCNLLMISLGERVQARPPFEVDGTLMVELATREEMKHRQEVSRREWVEKHILAIESAMPKGAESFDIWEWDYRDSGGCTIAFEREIGPVTFMWPGEVTDDGVVTVQERPDVMLQVRDKSDDVDVAEMRRILEALTIAIPLAEELSA